MAVTRDKYGYAKQCFQSDGKSWDFPRDLGSFLSTVDRRLLFVAGVNREMEPILKWLGEEVCTKLLDGFEVDGLSYRGGVLGVRGQRKVWSLKPFYTSAMLPEEDDCYGVRARGERLVECIVESGLPLMLHSCGAILSGMGEEGRGLPYMSAPPEVEEMAYNCYHGGWIEAMKLGFFEEAYDYDLSSAYPAEAASLLSCSGKCGYWVRSSSYVSDAYYGFCFCRIRLDLSLPLSPLMVRVRSVMSQSGRWPVRTVRNPVGWWDGWMVKEEIEFVVGNWLGEVEVLDGWWFIPTRYYQPFASSVRQLKRVRRKGERSGDELMKNIGKLVAATIQGKMMQSYLDRGKRVVGSAFNPVYAASLTARVRLKDAEVALEDWDDVLMIMVDGIISSKLLAVPEQWKLAHSGECVIANHGDYSIPGRETTGKLVRALEKFPSDTSYRLYTPRYESLGEALEAGEFELAGMHRAEARSRVKKVGKRYWPELPKTCEDLLTNQYSSSPLIASEHTRLDV